jgi:hypothetical protein
MTNGSLNLNAFDLMQAACCSSSPLVGDQAAAYADAANGLRMDGNTHGGENIYFLCMIKRLLPSDSL